MDNSGILSQEDAQAYLEMLNLALDDSVSILDKNLDYLFINNATYENLKLDRDEISPGDNLKKMHDLMMEKGLLTEKIIEKNSLSTEKQELRGPTSRFTKIMSIADGRTHRLTRTHLPNGHTISVASDVTELVETEKVLENALHLGRAGYWVYDLQTKTTWLSDNIKAHFDPETTIKVLNSSVSAGFHPEDRQSFALAIKEAILSKTDKFSVEIRTLHHSGTSRWSKTIGEILRNGNGKPIKIRGFIRDTHAEHLQAEELKHAKDQALAASHAKSEFLANMSHEIRTPMNGILGMAELLAHSNIDDQNKEHVDVIYKSANALLTIINDILDFSKIEAGALELDPVSFSLREVVNDVASLMTQQAKSKNLELIVNYDPRISSHFIADGGRIRQIIMNLVNNAIKFTESGHILIEVGVTGSRNTMSIVRVDVTDTGIGIEPAKMDQIFDNFSQADTSTTRIYGGTGLGLSISKKLTEMMNGRLEVRSKFGEGSTFSMTIPLQNDPDAKDEEFDTSVLQGKRIMVVDDIEVNCNVLRERLSNWGMQVETAEDAVEAMSILTQEKKDGVPFDLIISDYLMPGLNGLEFAKMMTASTRINDRPVIMLSSCDQPVPSSELQELNVEQFLIKPAREKVLFDSMVKVLTKSNLKETPDTAPQTSETTPATTEKSKILVAEDFALNRDVIRLMLVETPYEAVFANDGKQCVEAYKSGYKDFAAILMDISMPVMDGFEAAQKIIEYENSNNLFHIPIIALTGHALQNDKEKCLAAGMDDYLSKPVRQDLLVEKLSHWKSVRDELTANTILQAS